MWVRKASESEPPLKCRNASMTSKPRSERILGMKPKWTIRRMKTKWGSCNRETGHIWFNVELAKKHPDCLEYLAVHEVTHLLERGHGQRFAKLMDEHLPDWRERRDRLIQAPLGREQWVRS